MNGSIMYEWNGERVIIFAPSDREEAALVLHRCSELAAAGRAVRAGVLESPYRPGARFGLDCVGGAGLAIGHERIQPHGTAAEALREIESSGPSGAICVLISLRRMDRIHEISKTDYLVVVDGGVSWMALVSEIESAGLYLPYGGPVYQGGVSGGCPDVAPSGATVAEVVTGGSIASTDGRFGALREYVLSIEMATPAGGLIHTGSRAIKDVGGYDLTGFLLGEGGRCGVVTRVTLRLLPAPQSRAAFMARGTTEELRTLARDVNRRMRPAYLELYEGRVAALLAGEANGEADAGAPPAGDAAGEAPTGSDAGGGTHGGALLIGELQAAHAGAEDRLLEEAASASGAGPRPVRCDPAIIDGRGRFATKVYGALDHGNGIVYLSCENGTERLDHPGAVVYRSLFPERLHIVVPREEIDPAVESSRKSMKHEGAAERGESDSPDGTARDDPSIRERTFLDVLRAFGAERDPGLQAEVVLLYGCNGSLNHRRIHRDDFDRPVAAALRGEFQRKASGRRDPFDVLWARVRKVFDPQEIMLP